MMCTDLRFRIASIATRSGDLLSRVRRDNRGVAAVEFAIVVTLMVPLLFMAFETTQALQANRKVSVATRALADLASQTSVIANADMTNILNATAGVMAPFPTSKTAAVVTGIKIDDKGKATAAWSDVCNKVGALTDSAGNSVGQRHAVGSVMVVPPQLMPPLGTTGFLVLAEVFHKYVPIAGWELTGGIVLSDRLYATPRIGTSVTRSGTNAPCA
ncbi:TadE/TadG family type IV pilus assembly protein [Phreatobacter stygius]|nr:TadE/TadG family type IV pilus assembly protein [Phreatobacter stygius]